MNTKMSVHIVVTPREKNEELYDRLTKFDVDVMNLGGKIHVSTEIDIREDVIEKILTICHEYGGCEVKAQMK